MRILWLITRYWPAIGGAELHSRAIVHELAAQGHEVTVVSHWETNRTDWLLGTTLFAPASVHRYDDPPKVQVVRLGYDAWRRIRTVPGAAMFYATQEWAAQTLARQIERDLLRLCGTQWDIVHGVRSGREPLYVAGQAFAQSLNIPFVFTPNHHPRWVGRRYRIYHQLYRTADTVIALTQHERTLYESLGVPPERICVSGIGPIIPATASGARFRAAHGITTPLVLFVGQKYAYKGYSQLLAAAEVVWRTHPDVTFAFVGPRTDASRRVFRTICDPRVIEMDAVDLQTKGDAFAACDIFCLPSSQESFGGVYVEAWHYGKPVVGVDIPATREVICDGRDGGIARVGDAAHLADILTHLLDDPEARARMGHAGQQKVATDLDWPQVGGRIATAYAQAQQRRGEHTGVRR
jgi:glycosyltransferase involved in cell wall biosynthesis